MHILLPPSETKHSGGGGIFAPAGLSHDAELGEARARVRAALEALCTDEEAAASALKLGVKSRGEIAHNLVLETSGLMPAAERYTGVLYESLGFRALGAQERRWIGSRVSIQSALFGLIAASDRIPAYRLSASSRLPALGAPLKRIWGGAHAGLDWSALGWVLDLRSKDYAELAPLPAGRGAALDVVQRGPGGEVRALNHFNKAAKGDLVRRLATSRAPICSAAGLFAWAEREGLELLPGSAPDRITLVTDLGAPGVGRAGEGLVGATASAR